MTATIVATAVPVAIVTVARAKIAAPVAIGAVIVMTASARPVRRAPKQPPAKEHLNNEW